jgi:hypothetical protein
MEASRYINYNFRSKKEEKIFSCIFFLQFLIIKPDQDSLEMLDPDPYPDPMVPGPQH